MSSQNRPIFLSQAIEGFYLSHLNDYGDSSKGVGWKNDEAQNIRFLQLMKVIDPSKPYSINDLGCGTGKFFDFLREHNLEPTQYFGLDILAEMVEIARARLPQNDKIQIQKIESAHDMTLADYTVASGIFNVKYDATDDDWKRNVISTLVEMNKKSRLGFSFNLLTSYSDKEFMQPYLYYGDPLFYFDYCKRNFSRNIALMHDYDQYDFTIIVRKI